MLSIGELSRLTKVKIPTIRYYEQTGLITPSKRSAGNQRRYDREGVKRLSFIRHARELGLSISAISELIRLSESPEMPCAKAHQLAVAHLQSVEMRIDKLKNLQLELQRIVSACRSDHIGECHVISALADHELCHTEH